MSEGTGRTAAEVVAGAERALRLVQSAWLDYRDPARRPAALSNIVVYGASVSQVLKALDRKVPDFAEWWAPFSSRLANDASFRRLRDMRNEVLKEGALRTSASTYINRLGPGEMAALEATAPPGANGLFIGDQNGGSGWTVTLPDGTHTKHYIDLPASVGMTAQTITRADGTWVEVGKVLPRYVATLQEIVASAKARWDSESAGAS